MEIAGIMLQWLVQCSQMHVYIIYEITIIIEVYIRYFGLRIILYDFIKYSGVHSEQILNMPT